MFRLFVFNDEQYLSAFKIVWYFGTSSLVVLCRGRGHNGSVICDHFL